MVDLDEWVVDHGSWILGRNTPQVDLLAELRRFLVENPCPDVTCPVAAWHRVYKLLPMTILLREGFPSDCLRLMLIDRLERRAHADEVLTRTRSLADKVVTARESRDLRALKCGAYASLTPITS